MSLGFGGGSASGGAGVALSDPNMAYVRSDGDNGTAEIGNPGLPFLTMQAAWDAGATNFDLGVGTFAGITDTGNISFNVRGCGRTATIVTLVRSSDAGDVTIRDTRGQSVSFTDIAAYGATGAADTAGGAGGEIILNAVYATTVSSYGGTGGVAQASSGGPGGAGGPVIIENNSYIVTIDAHGGDGGAEFDVFSAGNGAVGGSVSVDDSFIVTVYTDGGGGGTGNANGADGGTLMLNHARISNAYMTSGAPTGSGLGATAGTLTAYFSSISNLDLSTSGTDGTIDGACVFIASVTGSPTINATISRINGVSS